MMTERLPDFLAFIPEGRPKQILSYCLGNLGLSIEEADEALYDSSKLARSLYILLRGGIYREDLDT